MTFKFFLTDNKDLFIHLVNTFAADGLVTQEPCNQHPWYWPS